MNRRDIFFLLLIIFFVPVLRAQSFERGWYFGVTKPAELNIALQQHLRRQVTYQSNALPGLQLGYYGLSKQLFYQVGINNLYYTIGSCQLLDNDTSQHIIMPVGGERAGNANIGFNVKLAYVLGNAKQKLTPLVGWSAKSDFGIIWNNPETSLVNEYLLKYQKYNLAFSLGLKQKFRKATVVYTANFPLITFQTNHYDSFNAPLPEALRAQSNSTFQSRGKYIRQIVLECAVLF